MGFGGGGSGGGASCLSATGISVVLGLTGGVEASTLSL